MSILELGVVALGLVGGYWLVSVLIDWAAARRRESPWETPSARPNSAADVGSPTDWSQVLGVSPSATSQEINAAYRRKIAEYHPDKVAQMGPEIRALAERRSQEINAAYDFAMKMRHQQGDR